MTERELLVRGTRMRMLTAGSGDPLVYLHGAGDLGEWIPALSALAEHHTVFRPDHPGFSGSDDCPDIDSVHDLAFFYLDLLDELGLDRVTLLGNSLGGWLAADLATIEPSRVSKLILVSAAGIRAAEPAPDMFLLSAAELAELTHHAPDARAAAVAQAQQRADDPAAFERYLRNRAATAHLGWNPYLHDPKLPRRLHRVTAPVLIMWGAHDRLLPASLARQWSELLPAARLEIIDEAGHLPLVERADAAVAAVRAFCQDGER
jgi:pimeloyl-ACP methyl ester carboxylesterase